MLQPHATLNMTGFVNSTPMLLQKRVKFRRSSLIGLQLLAAAPVSPHHEQAVGNPDQTLLCLRERMQNATLQLGKGWDHQEFGDWNQVFKPKVQNIISRCKPMHYRLKGYSPSDWALALLKDIHTQSDNLWNVLGWKWETCQLRSQGSSIFRQSL